ncbi:MULTISPECIES: HAMP domain-containing sensor histidine kinase [unclassified Bacillus (in: firmicutes)]|uniref:sensor histidine kinase n=1 Tax=unclassified Bacillus (in: firmicutes) TaxID=185979 RepID=UPI0020C85353|nr:MULTISPECIES: HAMP domain-containing sensor histidine kinase [unclassified Bacillus (in: firmicutes)]
MNKKLYYSSTLIIIALMVMGLLVGNPLYPKMDLGFGLHIILVIIVSICFWLYPKYETHSFRMKFMVAAAAYIYTIFHLYPDAWSNFIFICLFPAFAILFFDTVLFYFSLVLNATLMMLTFAYILYFQTGNSFEYFRLDITGNIMNFIGSQVLLFLIFNFSYERIKKQRSYYEQIQQSERLKTTGQLAAAVAHEIRNPLTVVKGFLQYYEQDASFSVDVKRNLALMIDELNTAELVISQFLTIAKPDNDKKLVLIDVKEALQSVTDLIKSYGLLNDNEIELDVEEGCYIAANLIEFKQLMINLLKNAIEASKKGDSVFVSAHRNKEIIEITITDKGCGMSQEEVKALGTPFYSLKSKGTGLGLMICYNIVAKYNGDIQFSSSLGQGTRVDIRFPCNDKQ